MRNDQPTLRVARPEETQLNPGRQVSLPSMSAQVKPRHQGMVSLFLVLVILPTFCAAVYLFGVARDQYHSVAAFSIRSEEITSPLEAFSAFTDVGTNNAPDSVILYDYLRSQPLVEYLDEKLDLRGIYTRHPDDPVFALKQDATVEDLVDYWERMTSVIADYGASTIQIEVRAFDRDDAKLIATELVEASAQLVNELSQIAQADAMRFANEDLADARDRLRDIRLQVREFRVENKIIDPEADVESQMGVVSELQSSLAQLLIRQGSLREYADSDDARLKTIERDIRAIRNQIATERAAVAGSDPDGISLSEAIGAYEELLVDLRFSEDAYTAAMAAAEQARAEARRKSRYAAIHIPPTLAEESIYPQRFLLTVLVFIGSLAVWAITALVYYNVRDRS